MVGAIVNQTDQNQTAWFIQALTGNAETLMDWRLIHDQRKDLPAHNYRGSLSQFWPTLQDYNARGYGVFCTVNALDGNGRELNNVAHIRAHVVDLDNTLTAPANYERAVAAGASFAVQSSPGKFHVYFRVHPYVGNEFYTLQQRKLAQVYDGDRKIIDATRVMRVPGFLHQKGEPFLVTGWPLAGFDRIRTADDIATELAHVNVIEHFSPRSPLGTPEMAAPSLDWLKQALSLVNPNDLDRGEWLSLSAAFKQAGWTLATPETLFNLWSEWCAQYKANDAGENLKLWNSIEDTETGWATFERRTPIKAYIMFQRKTPETQTAGIPVTPAANTPTPSNAAGVSTDSEILSPEECKAWFKDCYFIERTGQIFSSAGRFMNSTQFNGRYGGKNFIITTNGKVTDEPWKAATRSTCWTIPKVDHVRFLPDKKPFEIVKDELKRLGLNTYLPAHIEAAPGDITPFLNWFDRILPDKNDQKILFDYMAHCVKYPGYKIPWSPMLQSAEGIGKTIFREIMQHALGIMYVYNPKAPELIKSGSTFNAWMRGRLMIMVDEIKIDERRELIEILKPMITDARIEIQAKGVDQEMEDNVANWFFFSNYKGAIAINKNGRRFAIFYSALQSAEDILKAGMDEEYFKKMFAWLRDGGGLSAIAYWLLNYPIEKGGLPVRAPETSSYAEAIAISRSPMECVIVDCITDGLPGFKGGYISTIAVINKCKAAGIRSPNTRTVQTCLENMGYVALGRAVRAHMQEDVNARTELYGIMSGMPVAQYGAAQGYE